MKKGRRSALLALTAIVVLIVVLTVGYFAVPLKTIHQYTLLQLICLLVLGFVELSPLGILFPIFVLLLVPIRFLAARFFSEEHLAALDSEEEPEEEEMQWAD